jgi:hypothetical protein
VFPPEPPIASAFRAGTAHSRQGRAVRGAAKRTLDGEHRSGIPRKADGRRSGNTFLLVSPEPDSDWDSSADGSGSLTRRLITLIFAGRNRMDMIRRELPLTRRAGSIRKPFRIERDEDSPFRWSSSVIGAAVLACMSLFAWLFVYAAFRFFCCFSVSIAIVQMKPSNSRPTAVTIWFLFFPRASNFL